MFNRKYTFPISMLALLGSATLMLFGVIPYAISSFIPALAIVAIHALFSRNSNSK